MYETEIEKLLCSPINNCFDYILYIKDFCYNRPTIACANMDCNLNIDRRRFECHSLPYRDNAQLEPIEEDCYERTFDLLSFSLLKCTHLGHRLAVHQ